MRKENIDLLVYEEKYDHSNKIPFSIFYENQDYGIKLLKGDCVKILELARQETIDMIFADPPYFLSNGGITCHSGKMVSVNKGEWDKSKGVHENHKFNLTWLKLCQKVLKPNGTIWVSGTTHIIYSIGYAMQELGYKILNDIIWFKKNAPPNLSCRYFTHSTEIILWAAKNRKSKHYFNYELIKKMNNGKQMRNLWEISAPPPLEKIFGKHPTQKPVELLKRIILASTKDNDVILDPFCGSSTTGVAAILLGRKYIGIDIDENYLNLSKNRIEHTIKIKKQALLKELI